MRQTEAAEALGVSTSTLMRVCKRLDIGRWPWRAAGKQEDPEVIPPASDPPLSTPSDTHSLRSTNGWVVPNTMFTPQNTVSRGTHHQIDPIDLLLDSI